MMIPAIPDIVCDDPKDGKQRVVELKIHHQCKTRYPRGIVPTGRCTGVHERDSEQTLYQDYLIRLRLAVRKVHHWQTPAGMIGPLEGSNVA
jgi:hypothetical protein